MTRIDLVVGTLFDLLYSAVVVERRRLALARESSNLFEAAQKGSFRSISIYLAARLNSICLISCQIMVSRHAE